MLLEWYDARPDRRSVIELTNDVRVRGVDNHPLAASDKLVATCDETGNMRCCASSIFVR